MNKAMQVKEIKSEGLKHELEITLPANEIGHWVDEKLEEYGKTVKMPGFRPGKIPMAVLKQRYGRAVLGEVLESAVNDTTTKVLTEKGLRPALQPKIEVKEFDEGKDLVYSMEVEVLPEVKVADLKGLTFDRPVVKVDDKAVQEALERISKQNRDSKKVERAAKNGDVVEMDFHGRTAADNKPHPGMEAHGHKLELGSGQFIPGFEDQLIGKKAGDKVEVNVTFPEEYHAPELAGAGAIFDVVIHSVNEPVDAEINDEFAKKLGFADLAAVKSAIEKQIQSEYDQMSRMKLKRSLLDALDDSHAFEVPQGMLDLEYENIRQQIAMERQAELKDGKLEMTTEEEDELRAIAERRVRLGLVLSEIGNANNIQVADAELQRAVITEAQRYPGQEAVVFDYYRKNRQALEALRAPVFEDKVVDFISQMATINEKTVSLEELTAEEDEVSYLDRKKDGKSGEKSSTKKAAGGKAKAAGK
jgi:trigger factor